MNFNPADVIYDGIQEGFKGEHYYLFTDLVTKSSFTIGENEDLETKLVELRETFRKAKEVKP
jgi:hypothetical protein